MHIRLDAIARRPTTDVVPRLKDKWVSFATNPIDPELPSPRIKYFQTPEGEPVVFCKRQGVESDIYAIRTSRVDFTAEASPVAEEYPKEFITPPALIGRETDIQLRYVVFKDNYSRLGETEPISAEFMRAEYGKARQVWFSQQLLGEGLIADSFYEVYSGDNIVPFSSWLAWSDRNDPACFKTVKSIVLITSFFPVIDFREGLGIGTPQLINGKWFTVLTLDHTIGDGQAGVQIYGKLLCIPNYQAQQLNDIKTPELVTEDLDNFLTTYEYFIEADGDMITDWMGLGHPAYYGFTQFSADSSHNAFIRDIQYPVGFYAQKPLSLSKTAGQTGGQIEFGIRDEGPLHRYNFLPWKIKARYSISEWFRGFLNYESDGRILSFYDYPGVITWSGLINFRVSPPNPLGKMPFPFSIPGSGYTGLDNQHRCNNLSTAYLAKSGDYLVERMLKFLLENDDAMNKDFMDSPRGCGRLLIAWHHIARVVPATYAELAKKRMREHIRLMWKSWFGGKFVGDPLKTFRVLTTGSDIQINWKQGKDVESAIMWEHNIAAQGLYCAKVMFGDKDPEGWQANKMLESIAPMVVDCGIMEQFGVMYPLTGVEYPRGINGELEGSKPPADWYTLSSPHVNFDKDFPKWILFCARFIQVNSFWFPESLVEKAKAAFNQYYMFGYPDEDTAKWLHFS